MKPLRLDLRIRLEQLLIEWSSINIVDTPAIAALKTRSKLLQKDIETWYIKCQDEGIYEKEVCR